MTKTKKTVARKPVKAKAKPVRAKAKAKPVRARAKPVRIKKTRVSAKNTTVFKQPFAAAKAWGKMASQQPITALQNGFSSFMNYFK